MRYLLLSSLLHNVIKNDILRHHFYFSAKVPDKTVRICDILIGASRADANAEKHKLEHSIYRYRQYRRHISHRALNGPYLGDPISVNYEHASTRGLKSPSIKRSTPQRETVLQRIRWHNKYQRVRAMLIMYVPLKSVQWDNLESVKRASIINTNSACPILKELSDVPARRNLLLSIAAMRISRT